MMTATLFAKIILFCVAIINSYIPIAAILISNAVKIINDITFKEIVIPLIVFSSSCIIEEIIRAKLKNYFKKQQKV